MDYKLGFGSRYEEVYIPEKNVLNVLHSKEIVSDKSEEQIVINALQNPFGTKKLREMVKPGMKIAIVSSDITRPMPTYRVMPYILDELKEAKINFDDVTLVFAIGSHRKHTEEERKKLAGEKTYGLIRCVDSDPDDVIHMGTTDIGTPVDITRVVSEADFRICLGNVEYHYFAGYSGGAKAIMPGVSTREAIQCNHRFMTDNNSCAGKIEGNIVRADIEESVHKFCKVDFILNVVLDEKKKIVFAASGDVIQAHRKGCEFLDGFYRCEIDECADIVIVSQGGAPKDINLYQLQKSLDNSKHAVKEGGTIILVGACSEGFGEKNFEEWMREAKKPSDLIERIETNFKLGGHKAAAIAKVLEKAEICLVSEMPVEMVQMCFMTPMESVKKAIEYAFEKHGQNAKVIVMPYGGSTLPVVKRR